MARTRMRLQPVATESLVDLAYESIRQSIIDGRFKMGEHIVETSVASELEISRAPVREALKRLAQEGLAVEKPRRGTFVREISARDFIDIYNTRLAVEVTGIRLAVRRNAPLAPLEETVAKMRKAAARGDITRTVALELHLHEQISEASGNAYLFSVFQSLLGSVHLALSLDDAAYEDLEDVTREHDDLLDAMRTGNPDLAAAALHQHIISTVGPVLERLGGDPAELLPAP